MFVTPKYRRTGLDPIDGVPLAWNVHPGGFPIRAGDSPTLVRREQMDNAGVNLFARSMVFKIPGQIDDYNKVRDWIVNTASVVGFERVREDPSDAGAWVVWIGWTEIRGVIPSAPAVV